MQRFTTTDGRKVPNSIRCRGTVAVGGKRFTMTAYDGGLLHLAEFPFPVVADLAGMTIPSQRLPTPFDHDIGDIAGETDSIAITAAGLVVTGEIDPEKPCGAGVIAASRAGTRWEASIGAPIHAMEELGRGEMVSVNGRTFRGPLLIARRTTLQEISVVRRGANVGGTSLHIAARGPNMPPDMMNDQEPPADDMNADSGFMDWLKEQGIDDPSTLPSPLLDTLRSAYSAEMNEGADSPEIQAQQRENARISAIRIVARKNPELANRAIDAGWDARRTELESIRASRASGGNFIAVGGNSNMNTKEGLVAGLMIRAGFGKAAEKIYDPQTMEAGNRMRSASLVDYCRAALAADGKPVPHSRDEMIRASLSGGSVSVLLGDAAYKILLSEYKIAPQTWRAIADVKSVKNFKTQNMLRPSFLAGMKPLPRGGTFEHGTISEANIQIAIGTFGRQFAFSREDIIDDDLDALNGAAPGLGRAAARALADTVWGVVLANAGSFFSVGNGNYGSGGGSALSISSLGTAIKAMRLQQSAEGDTLDLVPAVLAVPPSLEVTARNLVSSGELWRDASVDLQPTGNPLQNAVTIVVEPRLENGVTDPKSGTLYSGSTTGWYVFASPAASPLFVAFLEGKDSPTLETFDFDKHPDSLTTSVRIFHDWGACLGDYRAAYKSAGA